MRFLALAVAAFAVLALALGLTGAKNNLVFLGAVGLLLAFTTSRAPSISSFLRIFAAIFATEYVVFGAVTILAGQALWPEALKGFVPPGSLPVTVGIFGLLIYAISFIPVIQSIMRIADRFFDGEDRTTVSVWPLSKFQMNEQRLARWMVVFLIVVNQAQVAISVRLSFFNRDWFNAIQNKDEAAFWSLLFTVFMFWAIIYVTSAIIEYVVQSVLMIRWRRWLTARYVGDWLDDGTHYRMALAGASADNPDQRIAEDINDFVSRTYSFSITLLSQVSSLVSFSIILWLNSSNFAIPGTDIILPGFLFWVALLYAAIGTLITHMIGRRLIPLNFEQQRYEADFRFSLARLREYSEQVALLDGERTEKKLLMGRFGEVIRNFLQIVSLRKKLMAFTAGYNQISVIIPYVVAAPFYFAGKVQFGILTQTAGAFARVEGALSFFVDSYVSLAAYKAVIDRLVSFDDSIARGRALGSVPPRLERNGSPNGAIALDNVSLSLPNGRPLVKADLDFRPGETALITGPSGSGKSTMLRAVAGIWPFGQGEVAVPREARVMLLPQRPYLPIGTLRAAVAYPEGEGHYSDAELSAALTAVGLPRLAEQLDEEAVWAQRLSGGEQQRVAMARALLLKPDWLFLDEATSALDEPSEQALYAVLKEKLPDATLVSIGHRSTLNAIHTRHIKLERDGEMFRPVG
jgi:putative ATP-binding cassette transporter